MENFRTYKAGFRNLVAWQEAHKLTRIIYKLTEAFPKQEQYGVISQLQRASSSVSAQIAEGSRMATLRHRKLFYERAYASAAEVDNFLELAHDLGYIKSEQYTELLAQINKASFLLHRLILSCRQKRAPKPTLPNIPALHTSPHSSFTPISHNHAPEVVH